MKTAHDHLFAVANPAARQRALAATASNVEVERATRPGRPVLWRSVDGIRVGYALSGIGLVPVERHQPEF